MSWDLTTFDPCFDHIPKYGVLADLVDLVDLDEYAVNRPIWGLTPKSSDFDHLWNRPFWTSKTPFLTLF